MGLGLPLYSLPPFPVGFDVDASLPTARHFTRMLRTLSNAAFAMLLDNTVQLLQAELRHVAPDLDRRFPWIPNISWPGSKRTILKLCHGPF
jgi:hypothetical protein